MSKVGDEKRGMANGEDRWMKSPGCSFLSLADSPLQDFLLSFLPTPLPIAVSAVIFSIFSIFNSPTLFPCQILQTLSLDPYIRLRMSCSSWNRAPELRLRAPGLKMTSTERSTS